MRSLLLTTALVLCTLAQAQVPQAFDFQGVARNASGNVLSNADIAVRLSVRSGSAGGTVVYQEEHAITTNAFGLFTVAVGQGTVLQGVFGTIAWDAAAHYLQVEMDAGSGYLDMGTTQLLSVPYALHAGGVPCPTVSMLGDTLRQGNGCFIIIPGLSAANGGCLDIDQDGFYDRAGCNTPIDCNDNDVNTNHGAPDQCGDGIDQDCNGVPDDHPDPAAWIDWHPDADGDGFGDINIAIASCNQPPGHILDGTDCDDSDADLFPGQGCSLYCTEAEVAWLDTNFILYRTELFNAFADCIGVQNQVSCIQQYLVGVGITLTEECNTCGIEWVGCVLNNCIADCLQGNEECFACANSAGCTGNAILCMGLVDADGDHVPAGSDCDDNNAAIHPGAEDVCDGIDNNCDGQVDPCCTDNDNDGFNSCIDCNDNDHNQFPGAGEVCDGIDNDCNGTVDEGCAGNECGPGIGACGAGMTCVNGFCVPCQDNDLDGYTTCDGDCDDVNLNINPGAAEPCNGLDDDCNGTVDDGCPVELCDGVDNNGNGQVDEGLGLGQVCGCGGVVVCDGQGGVTCSEPGGPEVCDGVDNDCDGLTDSADPGLVLVPCELQEGVCSGSMKSPDRCQSGVWLTCATSDYLIGSPAYQETETDCDTLDNDCDAQVDEGCP